MRARSIKLPKNNNFFLFGPRQTGKTTLIRQEFPVENTLYYDLLASEDYLRLLTRPTLFFEEVRTRDPKYTHIVIDEVQKIPALLDEVHRIIEAPQSPFFVLTGSSARKLKTSHANLLGGRAMTLSLFPMTLEEVPEPFALSQLLRFGSLPSVLNESSEEEKMRKLRSYVETYLREEIEREAQVRQIGQFAQFLTLAAHDNGRVLNFSNIARETMVQSKTIKAYYQILEDTLLGNFLFSFAKSRRKRLSQHPKFYFFDPGVVRALTKKLTVPVEHKTSDFGDAFEHFVILEILRANRYHELDLEFSYFRTEKGVEVDLIIETPRGKLIALEIKSTDAPDSVHLRGLKSFRQDHPQAELICVCLFSHRRKIGDVTLLPWKEVTPWLKSLSI